MTPLFYPALIIYWIDLFRVLTPSNYHSFYYTLVLYLSCEHYKFITNPSKPKTQLFKKKTKSIKAKNRDQKSINPMKKVNRFSPKTN